MVYGERVIGKGEKMEKIFKTMDGNEAAAYASYAFTEIAGIYPITPSSPMAEVVDKWSVEGKKNIFGKPVNLIEMQSEAGAAATMYGALESGSLATTYTASQGLALMIPVIYRAAGSFLPGVYHVSARTLGTNVLSIYGDHSDVMACRQTGAAMLASASVQECMDLGAVAHLSAIKGSMAFMHFFDGFRTSHEVQKIRVNDYEDLKKLVDKEALKRFRKNSLNPERPVQRGIVQNSDTYFQMKEAGNHYYNELPEIVEYYMDELNKLNGTDYRLFNYYGAEDAEEVIIAMGSVSGVAMDVVDELNSRGEKVGYLQVHLYRPFSIKHFLNEMPKTVKKITVLDRTKEPGATGEPLYVDVVSAYGNEENAPKIYGGRYGLASKDVDEKQINAVFQNMKQPEPKNGFTVGIVDDVTFLSLPIDESFRISRTRTISCRFWGLGSDGTVGANKNSIKIIGDHTDKYVQAYFEYDAKKSGGITKSNLRFGDEPIKSSTIVKQGDFVACHNQSYIGKYQMAQEVKPGGTFLLNTSWTVDELEEKLPTEVKKYIAENNVKFYIINASEIAREIGLGNRTNTILQSAFFKLAEIIPMEDAEKYMKEFAYKSYANKGDEVVNMNYEAIERGYKKLVKVEVPSSWATLEEEVEEIDENLDSYVRDIMIPVNAQRGDELPVSLFVEYADGHLPVGSSKYEKRGFSTIVSSWIPENCIQCNRCSFVCPHAAIRPFLLTEEEVGDAPESYNSIPAKGKGYEEYQFKINVSPYDCTGCGNCVEACPAKNKALQMADFEEQQAEAINWEYSVTLPTKKIAGNLFTIKESQFKQPLLEFSGACAGCPQTSYSKLLTQLYGDRLYMANATGCSQAWGAGFPQTPYTKNEDGFGPAWSNLLFENNAEFSLGQCLSAKYQREKIREALEKIAEAVDDTEIKNSVDEWVKNYDDGSRTTELSERVVAALENNNLDGEAKELKDFVLEDVELMPKKSMWMFGGDGWAYDIGYGGLDHVLSLGEDVNILIVDNELYANTGGQASKATPKGSVAQFAASGKKTSKKDLALLAMAYKDVYVAKVALGADMNQTLKTIKEAEEYPGTSIIIAYSPCINHGIKKGMSHALYQQKDAVEAGYWSLFRYNPALLAEGKNPITIDSKEPTESYEEFIEGEVRYASLKRVNPENWEELFKGSEEDAKQAIKTYEELREEF